MKNKLVGIIISMLLFATALSVVGTTNNKETSPNPILDVDWWPMFHHDPAHTGNSTSVAPNTNTLIWRYKTDGEVSTAPTIVEGMVYVGSKDSNVYCLNLTTGDLIWNYTAGTIGVSSPAIANGLVYIGSTDRNLYCLDADPFDDGVDEGFDDPDGVNYDLLWSYTTGGSTVYSAATVADDLVYIGSDDKKVYCLDADPFDDGVDEGFDDPDGVNYDILWIYTTGLNVRTSPAVADSCVYVSSLDGKLYCLDADPFDDGVDEGFDDPDGVSYDLLWSYTTGNYIESSPAVADGKVYIGSNDKKIYCLDATTGTHLWSYMTGSNVVSSPAVADGRIYVGSDDKKVYCLDADPFDDGVDEGFDDPDGVNYDILWMYTTDVGVRSSPAVADGKVYIGTNNKNITCLNMIDGSLIWAYTADGRVYSSPAVANGVMCVGSIDNYLYCFNDPPASPTVPEGPTEGLVNVEYTYTTSTTDPSGDQVYYKWRFGSQETDWMGPYDSGATAEAKYTWTEPGTYTVNAKAKDIYESESDWSPPLEVTVVGPNLTIVSIIGGIGRISATIQNTGNYEATEVNWSVTLDGGFFFLTPREVLDTIESLDPDESAEISIPVFGIGLGIFTDIPTITIGTECAEGVTAEETATAKIILIFVMLQ